MRSEGREAAMQNAPSAVYLTGLRLGRTDLRNRLVRASTSETMATADGAATPEIEQLYRDLAVGGVGLILTGHIYVDPRGQASPFQWGLHRDDLVASASRVVNAVHNQGGVIFAELGHCGSQSMVPGIRPVAPSIIPNAMYQIMPEEMTDADVHACINAFGAAAARAKQAGFDGIHIHGGNGYLIAEFNSPHTNARSDDWGGDAERRGRFVLEVYRSVRRAVGAEMTITMRLGMADSVPNGLGLTESLARVRLLAEEGLDGIEPTYGIMRSYWENIRPYVAVSASQAVRNLLVQRLVKPAGPEAYYKSFARAIKDTVSLPVILVGGVRTTETIESLISSGDADLVAMSRPFIREPDLAKAMVAGRTGMVDCVSCNMCLVHDGIDPLQCWRRTPVQVLRHVRRYYLRRRHH